MNDSDPSPPPTQVSPSAAWSADYSQRTPIKKGPPQKWLALLDRVDTEITNLARDRLTWKTVNDIAAKSEVVSEQPYFVNWVAGLYASSLALGVRKMNDPDPRAASLFNLFEKMAYAPEKLTREWFCSDIYVGLVEGMDRSFTSNADPGNIGHLDPSIVRVDQARLNATANTIGHYVNQHVAHAQARPNAPIPTYADLHASVDTLCELLRKYISLLKRADRIECAPIFQMPWDRVFLEPWSRPGAP